MQARESSSHTPFVRRVRFADVDFARVPFYGRYYGWVDEAWEYQLNAHGVWYSDMVGTRGIGLPVVEAHCRYRRPLRLDDEFTVQFRVSDLSLRGLTTEFTFRRTDDDDAAATGYVQRRFIDLGRFRPCEVTEELYPSFQALADALNAGV